MGRSIDIILIIKGTCSELMANRKRNKKQSTNIRPFFRVKSDELRQKKLRMALRVLSGIFWLFYNNKPINQSTVVQYWI